MTSHPALFCLVARRMDTVGGRRFLEAIPSLRQLAIAWLFQRSANHILDSSEHKLNVRRKWREKWQSFSGLYFFQTLQKLVTL